MLLRGKKKEYNQINVFIVSKMLLDKKGRSVDDKHEKNNQRFH